MAEYKLKEGGLRQSRGNVDQVTPSREPTAICCRPHRFSIRQIREKNAKISESVCLEGQRENSRKRGMRDFNREISCLYSSEGRERFSMTGQSKESS